MSHICLSLTQYIYIAYIVTKMTWNLAAYSPERILFNEHRHLVVVRQQYTIRIIANYTFAAATESLKT